MDHVVRRDEDAHLLAHRNDQRIVHLEQVVLPLLRPVLDLVAWRRQVAVEGDVFPQIVVAPFPLVAGHLDRHVRTRRVLHRDHGAGRRKGHGYYDKKGDRCPNDRQCLAVAELTGLMAQRTAMPQNRVEHEQKHDERDGYADAKDDEVQVIDLMGDRSLRRLEVELRRALGDGHAR